MPTWYFKWILRVQTLVLLVQQMAEPSSHPQDWLLKISLRTKPSFTLVSKVPIKQIFQIKLTSLLLKTFHCAPCASFKGNWDALSMWFHSPPQQPYIVRITSFRREHWGTKIPSSFTQITKVTFRAARTWTQDSLTPKILPLYSRGHCYNYNFFNVKSFGMQPLMHRSFCSLPVDRVGNSHTCLWILFQGGKKNSGCWMNRLGHSLRGTPGRWSWAKSRDHNIREWSGVRVFDETRLASAMANTVHLTRSRTT